MGAFNGSGTFVRSYSWVNDAANAIKITASRMDTEDTGFATGLTNCVTRDGQSPALANLPMGGFKLTGLANGSAASDSAAFGQILAGGTYTGKIVTLASAAVAGAGFNLPAGVAPTTPADGDVWTTTAGLFARINAVTYQFAPLASPALTTPTITGGTIVPAATPTASDPGFLGLPQVSKTASYTLTMADLFKEIYISGTTAAQTITIPANGSVAAPIGAFATITNDSNQNWSIAITTDTLLWSPNNTTGTRTLAAGGTATIRKVTATRWWIYGTGLT